MTWQKEVDDIEQRKRLAQELGGQESVARQHGQGRLTIRERIAGVIDKGFFGIYRVKELSLTGNYLSAEQAAEWGLVNHVAAVEELLPNCQALAKDIVSCAPEMVRSMKQVIDRGYAVSLEDGLKIEHEAWAEHARTITPEAIAVRRSGIQQRGRTQSS